MFEVVLSIIRRGLTELNEVGSRLCFSRWHLEEVYSSCYDVSIQNKIEEVLNSSWVVLYFCWKVVALNEDLELA